MFLVPDLEPNGPLGSLAGFRALVVPTTDPTYLVHSLDNGVASGLDVVAFVDDDLLHGGSPQHPSIGHNGELFEESYENLLTQSQNLIPGQPDHRTNT